MKFFLMILGVFLPLLQVSLAVPLRLRNQEGEGDDFAIVRQRNRHGSQSAFQDIIVGDDSKAEQINLRRSSGSHQKIGFGNRGSAFQRNRAGSSNNFHEVVGGFEGIYEQSNESGSGRNRQSILGGAESAVYQSNKSGSSGYQFVKVGRGSLIEQDNE